MVPAWTPRDITVCSSVRVPLTRIIYSGLCDDVFGGLLIVLILSTVAGVAGSPARSPAHRRGCGGSASTDVGIGMVQALGAHALDAQDDHFHRAPRASPTCTDSTCRGCAGVLSG